MVSALRTAEVWWCPAQTARPLWYSGRRLRAAEVWRAVSAGRDVSAGRAAEVSARGVGFCARLWCGARGGGVACGSGVARGFSVARGFGVARAAEV